MLQLLPASIIGRVVLGGLAATALGIGAVALWRRFRSDNDAADGARLVQERQPGTVRVMTFNIKAAHGVELLGDATPAERERNLRAIASYIERADPDVVLLQEVEQGYDRGGTYAMYDRLRELLHANDGAMSEPRIGAAIITRNGYTIADRPDGSNQVHSDAVRGSSLMEAAIRPPADGTPFTVVNAHTRPDNVADMAKRVGAIRNGSLDPVFPRRVIVGGDFNTRTSNVAHALAGQGSFTDALTRAGVPMDDWLRRMTSPTPFGNTPWTVPDRDQIHLSDGFGRVTLAQVQDPRYPDGPMAGAPLSDHRPLVADVSLVEPPDAR